MSSSAIKSRKKIFSINGGADASLTTRVTTLENNEYEVIYFEQISSDTGTITKPTGATILENQFPGGVDAYVSTLNSGQPTGDNPTTAGGVIVDVASFDTSGNYTLTGVPSSYPVALIYVFRIKALDWSNVNVDNIVDYDDTTIKPVTEGGTGTDTQFTLGSMIFAGASGIYSQDNSNLFYDSTNKSISVGTNNTDPYGLGGVNNVFRNTSVASTVRLDLIAGTTGSASLTFGNGTIRRAVISADNGSILNFHLNTSNSGTSVTPLLTLTSTSFTVAIDGVPLSVNSTNNNTNKIVLRDSGTARGYLGASSTQIATFATSAGSIVSSFGTTGNLGIGTSPVTNQPVTSSFSSVSNTS